MLPSLVRFFPVFRLAKVYTVPGLTALTRHWNRTSDFPGPNIDRSRSHLNGYLIGAGHDGVHGNGLRCVMDRLAEHGVVKRSNGGLCIEGVVSASPTWFRPNGSDIDPRRLEQWVSVTERWLRSQFGDDLVAAVVHLDESTPHLHFYATCWRESPKGRVTSFSKYMRDRGALRAFQDGIADFYRDHLDPRFERGVRHSGRQHQDSASYIRSLESERDDAVLASQSALSACREESEARRRAEERWDEVRKSKSILEAKFRALRAEFGETWDLLLSDSAERERIRRRSRDEDVL